MRSTRTVSMNASATRPKDSALCDRMPSSVSPARRRCCCKATSSSASAMHSTRTVRLRLTPNRMPSATPSSAECDSVSPKYAMRRHTTKDPSGPATTATPIPASSARSTKSSMAGRHLRGLVVGLMVLVIVRMVMVVGVDGEAVDRRAEERAIGGIAAHRVGMATAADVMIEADDAVGGGHHQMQVVRHQQHAAAPRVTQAPDEGEELGLAGDVDALHRLVEHQQLGLAQQRPR